MAHKGTMERITVYVPPELRADFKEARESNGLSESKQGELLIKNFVKNEKRKGK